MGNQLRKQPHDTFWECAPWSGDEAGPFVEALAWRTAEPAPEQRDDWTWAPVLAAVLATLVPAQRAGRPRGRGADRDEGIKLFPE